MQFVAERRVPVVVVHVAVVEHFNGIRRVEFSYGVTLLNNIIITIIIIIVVDRLNGRIPRYPLTGSYKRARG